MKNIPKVRFLGFDDEWERHKLGNLGDFKSGIGFPDNEQGGKSGIPFFKISDMSNIGNEVEMITSNNYVTQDQISRKNWKVIENVPAIIFAKVGAALMLNRKRLVNQPFLIDNNTMSFIFDGTWDINFGFALFQTLYLPKHAQVGALPSYNASDIAAIKVILPDKTEQSQIGALFSTIDSLLSSYKYNLENYQSFKKSMLTKMFPRNGQTVPEIRLDGFEGEWKLKLVKDLVTPVVREVAKPTESYKRLSIRSHAKGTFHNYVADPSTVSMDKLYVVKENDLVVNITFAWEHAIAIAKNEDDGLLVSHRFPTYLIDKADKDFMQQVIRQERFRQQMDFISPGGAGRNRVLNKNDFLKLKLIVPSMEEQKVIGSFFSNLDELISYYQTKIEELETLKKKLLQDMFI